MLNKNHLLFIFGIFLISFVSAQVSISPSSVSVSAYPGETISEDFNISVVGNKTVFVSSLDPQITLSPSSFLINGTNEITINITFSKDFPSGISDFEIRILLDEKVIPSTPSQSSGSGGGGIKTIYKNNTEYVDVPIYIYQNVTNQTDTPIIKDEPKKPIDQIKDLKNNKIILILLIVLFLIIIGLFFFIKHLIKKIQLIELKGGKKNE